MLVTCSRSVSGYRALLERGCAERVEALGTFAAAASALGERDYSAVVIDEDYARTDPSGEAGLLRACGTTCFVYVNLATADPEAIVKEITSALSITRPERIAAMRQADARLRNQLRYSLTGILLSSELAMSVPELPRAAQVKIKFVHDLAQGMRRQLEA